MAYWSGSSRQAVSLTQEMRIVLLGSHADVKASCGNAILGQNVFSSSLSSLNLFEKHDGMVLERRLVVINTPELLGLIFSTDEQDMRRFINMILPGPHALLLVLKPGTFTDVERGVLKHINSIFGEGASEYVIVVFMHEEYVGTKDVDSDIRAVESSLQVRRRPRHHLQNNGDQSDVLIGLLESIEKMVKENGGHHLKIPDDSKPHTDFTEGDMRRVKNVLKEFSKEAIKRTIVITTDEETYDSHLSPMMKNKIIHQLIKECGGGHLQLDEQKTELCCEIYKRVDKILKGNLEDYLTCEIHEDVKGTPVDEELMQSEQENKKSSHREDNRKKEMQIKRSSEGSFFDQLAINFSPRWLLALPINLSGKQKLNLVLCGSDATLKSSVSKLLRGKKIKPSHQSEGCEECVKREEKIHGRLISLVELPALNQLSEEEVMHQTLRCVSLCDPGVHAFLLVLPVGPLTDEDKAEIEMIQKIFDSREHFMVLFITELSVEGIALDFVKSSESQSLMRLYGGQCSLMGLKEPENSRQIPELLDYIEKKMTDPYSLQMYVKAQENRARHETEKKLSELESKIKELPQKNQSEDEVKNTNEGRYFTNSMFEETEMSIKKKMEQILKEKARDIQTQKDELKANYDRVVEDMMKRFEKEKQTADEERIQMENHFREKEEKLKQEFEEKEKAEQMKRETEKQKRSEEERQRRAEYHQKIEEMKREIENLRSKYEKKQKEREEEDRKREEKYRQDLGKMKNYHECIIAELLTKQEEETKKRHMEEKKRNEEEETERERWKRKIKEAENDTKVIKEEIKQQQREWEDEKKRQMREREEEERTRKEKHKEQLREKQEELETMRKTFEREREEGRQKTEKERQRERSEREEKERECEEKKTEMKRFYEQLERERKEEWERRKREDDERREEDRKRWKKMIEDQKQELDEEIKRRETQRRSKEREQTERNELKRAYDEKIKDMKKKHKEEARKQAEEFHLKERNLLKEHQKKHEILQRLYKRLKEEKGEEIKYLQKQVEELKNKSSCVIL
ncbi:hypothetical protein Q8A67_000166 [Cirrhinus molitorella]|uniref:AIG1-type G domain-containing protein n=1 Tax=Cirrhinus molitorella TaxID=172907 RepID=A0AA88Q722_9TELE|nr:hypothetical protein Q8A67_000166 [Cirrhinus molitorella]